MKKIISFFLVLALFAGLSLAITAAPANFKSYSSASEGELLYKFNFNGDAFFSPSPIDSAADNYTFTVGDGGYSLTVKGKVGGSNASTNFYGGIVQGLKANSATEYVMLYKVRANGASELNNSVGIGGLISNGNVNGAAFYNNYSNHNTSLTEKRRAVLSYSGGKILQYKYFDTIGAFDIDTDGFITMMLEFKGSVMSSYILKDGGEYGLNKSNWIPLQSTSMNMDSTDDNMGFMLYAYYNVVDTTIKNVELYKGGYSKKINLSSSLQTIQGDPSPLIPTLDGVISDGEYAASNTISPSSARDFTKDEEDILLNREYLTPALKELLSYDSTHIYYAIEFEMRDFYSLSLRTNVIPNEIKTSELSEYLSPDNCFSLNVINNGSGGISEWKASDPRDNSQFFSFDDVSAEAVGIYNEENGKGCVEFKINRETIDSVYNVEAAKDIAYSVKLFDTDDGVAFVGTTLDASLKNELDGYSGYLPRYMKLGEALSTEHSYLAPATTTTTTSDETTATSTESNTDATTVNTEVPTTSNSSAKSDNSTETEGCGGMISILPIALLPALACFSKKRIK